MRIAARYKRINFYKVQVQHIPLPELLDWCRINCEARWAGPYKTSIDSNKSTWDFESKEDAMFFKLIFG